MPYSPGISYRGDEYLYRGLQNLGQGIGALGSDIGEQIRKDAEEKRKQQEEQITNDAIMQHARQQGRVTPEEFDKYQQASWKQKNAIAHGHIFNMAQDMKEQMAAIKQEAMLGRIDAATARQSEAASRTELEWWKARAAHPEMPPGKQPGDPYYAPGTKTPIGVWQPGGKITGVKPGKPLLPRLNDDQMKALNWAQGTGATPKNVKDLLPEDLRALAQKAMDNPKDPRADLSWTKIKSEIVKRYTTPLQPATPELQADQPDQVTPTDQQ